MKFTPPHTSHAPDVARRLLHITDRLLDHSYCGERARDDLCICNQAAAALSGKAHFLGPEEILVQGSPQVKNASILS